MKKGVVIVFLVVAFVIGLYIGLYYERGITGAAATTTEPSATIIAPTPGSTVSGQVVIRATAADKDGIQKVEFLLDGIIEFTDTIPTADGVYQWLLDTSTVPNGQHTIGVAPHDTTGDFNDLAAVTVTIQNAGSAAGAAQAQQQRIQLPQAQPVQTQQQVQRPQVTQPPTQPVQQTQPVRQQVTPQSARPAQTQQRAPADVSDGASAPEGRAKYPLWLTLVASFGVIILVSGLLVFAIQKIRAVPEVPESIKTYVSVSMQQGYPVTGIHAALEQQGWDKKLIEEAFKDAMGETPKQ